MMQHRISIARRRKRAINHTTSAVILASQFLYVGIAEANAEVSVQKVNSSEINHCADLCLTNETEQFLAGEWHWQRSNSITEISFESFKPHATMKQPTLDSKPFYKLYTWGRVCFEHRWWNLARDAYGGLENPILSFTIRKGSDGKLTADPDEYRSSKSTPLLETDPC